MDGWYYEKTGSKSMAMSEALETVHLGVSMKKINHRYTIMVHDDNEFVVNMNYIKRTVMKDLSKIAHIQIRKVEMVEDCENSESYSFRKCVEEFMIKSVGCRPRWIEHFESYPTCNINETFSYLNKNAWFRIRSPFKVASRTGCKRNCIYYKYDIVNMEEFNVHLYNEDKGKFAIFF